MPLSLHVIFMDTLILCIQSLLLISQCIQIESTALFAASVNGHSEVLHALIMGGADVNITDEV